MLKINLSLLMLIKTPVSRWTPFTLNNIKMSTLHSRWLISCRRMSRFPASKYFAVNLFFNVDCRTWFSWQLAISRWQYFALAYLLVHDQKRNIWLHKWQIAKQGFRLFSDKEIMCKATILYCKAILGRVQPGIMRWCFSMNHCLELVF